MTHHNHHHHENLSMMDQVTTKYGQAASVTLSRTLAIILVVIFFICLIATGLLVYSFTSGCPKNETFDYEMMNRTSVQCEASVVIDDAVPTVVITTTTTQATTSMAPPTVEKKNKRLSTDIIPTSYDIGLIPFLEKDNFTFHGEETILINVTRQSQSITLHALDLTVDVVSVRNVRNESVSVKDVRLIKALEFLIIDLDGVMEAGAQYYVYVKFKGVLNDMLEGFYRSSYVENNQTRWIAATQFQATDARKAFPCFDEPAFKATFRIRLARNKSMTAISNMPLAKTTDDVKDLPDYVWDHFEETLPMSTYLVAFLVSDFRNISRGIFSVWARPSALSQAKFAVEMGPMILKYYERFFGIKYPLPKVDMVAIPDFSAGAMENWGLITYREPALLYEKGVSSTMSKQQIAHVVAHELAHQWFGNLVTPVWWEDLWLNEGFATYVEYLGAHAVNPKWKDLDFFLVSELHDSLRLDALKSSHPISVKVNDPDEIGDIFDRISYSKGASIIRMMRDFLGDKVFHTGLNKYLKNRMYRNAEQDDLWQTLTEATKENNTLPGQVTVKEIMDTWTLQTGYPLVTVSKQETGEYVLSQERYTLNRNTLETDQSLWWIPITMTDKTTTHDKTWLKKEKSVTFKSILTSKSPWYLVNVHQNGYYRVNYQKKNWQALTEQLRHNGHSLIHPRNRAQLIDDAMNLAYAGYLSYEVALNVTLYLTNEREYVPWKTAIGNFRFLHDMFLRSSEYDKFKIYLISLLKDFYSELTFKEGPNDEPTKILNRMEILDYACKLGLKDCVLQAVQQFQNWRNSANPDKENSINPDLRSIVYCAAISDGGQEEWEFAWARYLNTNVATDKEILLTALACSKDIWLLTRYLEWSITENSGIRKHDTARVFASVSENPIGKDLAYRFLKSNWQRIRDYLGPSSTSMSSVVRTSTEQFNTEEEVTDFKMFFEKRRDEFGVALRTAQQAIEQGEANTRWMKNYFRTVREWFENVRV